MASVLVPLAPGCEELEAITIIDLLVRAGVEVVSAGLVEGPIRASRGVVILPDTTLDEVLHLDFDMVVLPGGQPGADHLDRDPRIHTLLQKMSAAGKYTAAICAAPKILAHAGLLDGRRATGYPGTLENPELPAIEKCGRGSGAGWHRDHLAWPRHSNGLHPHPDRKPGGQGTAGTGRGGISARTREYPCSLVNSARLPSSRAHCQPWYGVVHRIKSKTILRPVPCSGARSTTTAAPRSIAAMR